MNSEDLSSLFAALDAKGSNGTGTNDDDIATPWDDEKRLKRLTRPIKVSAVIGETIDRTVISYPLYNSFNYSVFLPKDYEHVKLSLGITSPNFSEGKTTTVCNLAAALSMGSGRRTLVVDLNLVRPRLHEVFGTPRGPGLAEALLGDDICVVPTQLDNLFVLPIGNSRIVSPSKLPVFREVLSSLLGEFEFIIVDMPPATARAFPTLIANQLSGLLVVVRSHFTKRRDVGKLFRRVREEKIIGFVMNGVDENDL